MHLELSREACHQVSQSPFDFLSPFLLFSLHWEGVWYVQNCDVLPTHGVSMRERAGKRLASFTLIN